MKNAAVVFVLGLVFLAAPAAGAAVSPGEAAPDFSLTDTYGQTHSLSDHRGEYVVLEWINHDCPFVKKHYAYNDMQSLQEEYREKGVVWFSVASSAEGKQGHYSAGEWNRLTSEKGAVPTAVLLDSSGDVGRSYGAQTTPHMYVINPEGTLIYAGAIDDTPSTDPEDIATSENYVVRALDEALAGESVSVPSTKAYGCSVKY